jgi:hypothetical protein
MPLTIKYTVQGESLRVSDGERFAGCNTHGGIAVFIYLFD